MIKVRFYANNGPDVCDILEKEITCHIEIEDWICQKVEGISFDGMDFPGDMECFYECYFSSNDDKTKSEEIFILLEGCLLSFNIILIRKRHVKIDEQNSFEEKISD